jgi:hypothetical protein
MTQLLATAEGYLAEQRFRDKSELPDYEAYCKYRSGRCCMGQVVSLIEYAILDITFTNLPAYQAALGLPMDRNCQPKLWTPRKWKSFCLTRSFFFGCK